MTPDEALEEARSGALRPVYLVMGEERWFSDRVVRALRDATTAGGIPGFNEDKFTAGEGSHNAVLSAARSLPMMAKRRFVLVRSVERWEKKADEEPRESSGKKGKIDSPLDDLAEYAKAPCDSCVLVLLASKLHGQRRIVTAAKKSGFLVDCAPIDKRSLPGWLKQAAKDKGNAITPEALGLLAELGGTDLGHLADAMERLSLFVGAGKPITEEAVATLVTRVTQSSIWGLLDAITSGKRGPALALVADNYEPSDRGLPLLGSIGWSVRQLVKIQAGLADGLDPYEAATRAGVSPHVARERGQAARALRPGVLPRWVQLLSESDLALKGSRRPPQSVLETLVLEMMRA